MTEEADNSNQLILQFGEITIVLPKDNIKGAWEKLKKMMEIYLEEDSH
jgi:hypothetical protein